MMMVKFLAMGVIAVMISLCCGHLCELPPTETDVVEKPQWYCGKKLAITLAELCYEAGGSVDKRSNSIELYNTVAPPEESAYFPSISADEAQSMGFGSRSKRIVGVVDECCYKKCYIDELKSYC